MGFRPSTANRGIDLLVDEAYFGFPPPAAIRGPGLVPGKYSFSKPYSPDLTIPRKVAIFNPSPPDYVVSNLEGEGRGSVTPRSASHRRRVVRT